MDHDKLDLCEDKLNLLYNGSNLKLLIYASIEYGSFKINFLASIKTYIEMHADRTVKHIALFQTILNTLTNFESDIEKLNNEILVVEDKSYEVENHLRRIFKFKINQKKKIRLKSLTKLKKNLTSLKKRY